MISSFTPCLNFITQNAGNGSASPTADCCTSLKSLLSSSMECSCLIITGNVPFQIPINRTLAISLPQACKLGGVPVQCKSSGAPLPAPGPASFGLAPSPFISNPGGSTVPGSASPALTPEPDTTLASPPVNSESPTTMPGLRPVLTPSSAAKISNILVPPVLLVIGIMVLKFH
ncbi:Bifunctional inhibitor/plant lipid transfer protein/seed storage helical domain [Macleaya cordata]|uniref:Bifunctional inhibitor/plant lipid transfer protein/seed storage helical domain n=1 Tax=Macleaya cordata TaxID=56857 RepID=A0A200QYJ0_MACCD|nr:Bifunctional inhibitor/plant lipid transfer protein/seed storage helical domain [Macleaya cordata]